MHSSDAHPCGFHGVFRTADTVQAHRLEIFCHGNVYNTPDLCRLLGLATGTPLRQVLLAGWHRWAENLFERIDGVYSLALSDGLALHLYRDPSGLRNLYLDTGRWPEVSFGTDLNQLMRMPGAARRLARASLHEYLRFGDIAAPRTIYEGVIAVEAGQLLRCSARGVEERPLQPQALDSPHPASFEEALEMLDKHLDRSVQTRLSDAARPASFLSGGIDSALLCSMASRYRQDTTAVTVGFSGSAFDESPAAAQVAAHLGLAHEVLRFDRGQELSGFERLSAGAEQPIADPAAVPTLLAFEHCRGRFDVVLDGTGADEAVGSMPPRHVRLAVSYASVLPRAVRARLTRLLRSRPALAGYAPLVDFEHPADTMIRWRGFTRQEIEDLCGDPVSFEATQFYKTHARYPRGAHFERYSALINAMPSERLNQAILVSGLDVRFPFWDHATDRFIRQLRTEFRYLPGHPKRILRSLLARHVPAEMWNAPKHGFDFPLASFLVDDSHALVRRYLDTAFWRSRGVLSPATVAQWAKGFMNGDMRLAFRVWALVMLGAWLEAHGDVH